MQTEIEVTLPSFRSGTKIPLINSALVYNAGGIGDFIHWTTAIQYVIETYRHLHGVVVSPSYFAELAKHWLGQYAPRFEVRIVDDFKNDPTCNGRATVIPNPEQYANACSFHLFELGFIYYAQIKTIPQKWKHLPKIVGNEVSIAKFRLPKDYAVIPTEATADNRRLPAQVVTELARELQRRGITPVLLGKGNLTESYKTEGCIDLRNQTSLLEAACIMAGARFVIGLDGGLLHLASCSSVPVVFIFSSVDPKLRVPPRRPAEHTVVITPSKDLPCRFCNSCEDMRWLIGHDFKNCLYGDNLCVTQIKTADLISALQSERLIE